MERWGLYVSGILYGTFEKEGEQIFHRALDTYTGCLKEREKLEEETSLYTFGKINVREAILHAGACETALQAAKAAGETSFVTIYGERYEKRDERTYAQRQVKYPRDLIVENGTVAAFVTPSRDQCSVLVREGMEDFTIVSQWKEMYGNRIYGVEPVQTEMVPMRDGVLLATDVYLPRPLDPSVLPGKVPAVLVRTPYGKGNNAASYYRFVQRGYAVVVQDVRGREDSEGEWLPMYHEVEDGDDTLTWIAGQTWSDGSVGMTGGSYLGYVQWAAAASENPHLKAMLSSVCAGSPFVDIPRRGGCFNSGMLAWAFMVSGQRSAPELMVRDDWEEVLDIRPLENLPKKALGYDVPFLKTWISHMDYDEIWARGNWKERTKSCRVPALIMSGWFDDNGMGTTEALELYEDYKEKKVILGPWMHGGNADYDIHGFALGNNALRYDMDLLSFAWLEHYLKGIDNGIEKTPTVEYYTMGTNRWKTAENWPVPGTRELVLYLDGDGENAAVSNQGKLSYVKPEAGQYDCYRYDPKHPSTHIVDMSENELEVPEDYTREETRDDVLCYSTEILKENLTVTGDALAEIYLSSNCEDTDLVVRITDVDQNGRSMKLADGVISAKYRNQFDRPEFLEAGKVYPVRIRTTKLSHTFLKGHRLRVTITSSAKNFIFPNRNTRDGFNSVECKTAKNRIHRGGSYSSRVVLHTEEETKP